MKAHITKIDLNRAEGPHYDTGRKSAATFDAAQHIIDTWARTAPESGGYDKVDFKLFFSDGENYDGRLDIKHLRVADDNDLAKHVKNHLEIYSGQWQPPYMDDERYARFMANLDPKDRAECARFLAKHQIGDGEKVQKPHHGSPSVCVAMYCGKKARKGKSMCTEHLKTHPLRPRPDLQPGKPGSRRTRKNPTKKGRKPGKYPGFVIQTIEVPKKYSKTEAKKVAKRHGATRFGIDEKPNYYRFRQVDPAKMTKKYISLKLPHGTIIVKALPKSTAKRAGIKNTPKKLTIAERKRLSKLMVNDKAFNDFDKSFQAAKKRPGAKVGKF